MNKASYHQWVTLLTGRKSKKEILTMAGDITNHPTDVDVLMSILQDDNDAHTKMNAAWVLYWLSTDAKMVLLTAYYDMLIDLSMSENLKIRRGLLISILLDMPLPQEPRMDFLDYCLSEMMNEQQHDSCRSSMIKMAALICSRYPELMAELRNTLSLLPSGLPPSIASAKRKVCNKKRISDV